MNSSSSAEDYLVVYNTCPDQAVAEQLAEAIIETRCAACVNILPAVMSFYRWEGEIEKSAEVLLVIKSRADRFDALKTLIGQHHPYELPEIVAVPIKYGSNAYLKWIDQCL